MKTTYNIIFILLFTLYGKLSFSQTHLLTNSCIEESKAFTAILNPCTDLTANVTLSCTTSFYKDASVQDLDLPQILPSNSFQLFSHGRPGELLLEGKWRNAAEIVQFLQPKLSTNITQINIYGCEFAKGTIGLDAVRYIEKQLGVTVSASTNITGIDGDWKLEIGNTKSALAFNTYKGNLQCTFGSYADNVPVTWVSNGNADGYTTINENTLNSSGGKLYSSGANVRYTTPDGFKAGDTIRIVGNNEGDTRRGALILTSEGNSAYNSGPVLANAFSAVWSANYVVIPNGTATFSTLNITGEFYNGVYLAIDAVLISRPTCNTCNVNIAPAISTTILRKPCPPGTFDLSGITATNTPDNTILTWHSDTPAANNNLIPASNISSLNAGIYYAAFYNTTNSCYSGPNGSVTTKLIASDDTDCDGVSNVDDLDDDNDGIVDITECAPSFQSFDISSPVGATSVSTIPSSRDNVVIDIYTLDNNFNLKINGVTISSTGYLQYYAPDPGNLVRFDDTNLTYGQAGSGTNFIWTVAGNVTNPLIRVIISPTGIISFYGSKTLGESLFSMHVTDPLNSFPWNVSPTNIIEVNQPAAVAFNPSFRTGIISAVAADGFCDSDNDGITNQLDLDSDGDGCSDALEGGANFTNANLVNSNIAGGNSGTGYTGSSTIPIIQNLGNTVGSTGVPTIAGTGQTIGDSINGLINSCICYTPGITSGTGGIASVTGISNFLGLLGNPTYWLTNMPKNGALVMGSKDKGFVITRIANPETVITGTDAVKGMLVFDTASNCLKMYDGTEWFCLTQKCVDN